MSTKDKKHVTPIRSSNQQTPAEEPKETVSKPAPPERDVDHMTTLMKQVEAESSIKSSVDVLLRGVASQIATWKNDPGKIQEISDRLIAMSPNFASATVKAA